MHQLQLSKKQNLVNIKSKILSLSLLKNYQLQYHLYFRFQNQKLLQIRHESILLLFSSDSLVFCVEICYTSVKQLVLGPTLIKWAYYNKFSLSRFMQDRCGIFKILPQQVVAQRQYCVITPQGFGRKRLLSFYQNRMQIIYVSKLIIFLSAVLQCRLAEEFRHRTSA